MELPKAWVTLIEWNNEMIASVGRGDREKATRIAREILSNEQWGGFIPANAILGTATAMQGGVGGDCPRVKINARF